jgi:uncharacterized membrane protein YbhN (UPF0104 family)
MLAGSEVQIRSVDPRRQFARVVRAILATAVTGGLLWFCFRQVDAERLLATLASANLPWLASAIACVLFLLPITAYEWRLLLPAVGRIRLLAILQTVAQMVAVQNSVHHFAGHALAIVRLGQSTIVTRTQAVSLLTLDQLAEGCARLTFYAMVAFLVKLPTWAETAVRSIGTGVLCMTAVLVLCAWRLRRKLSPVSPAPRTRRERVLRHLFVWLENLHALRNPQLLVAAVALAWLKKIVRAAAIFCVQTSLGISLAPAETLVVVMAVELGTTVSVSPGNLGVFEASAVLAYEFLGVDASNALALALTYHAVYAFGSIVPGAATLSLGYLPFRAELDEPRNSSSNG